MRRRRRGGLELASRRLGWGWVGEEGADYAVVTGAGSKRFVTNETVLFWSVPASL